MRSDSSYQQLQALYAKLEAAAASLPLATTPTDIVPGEGDPQATILLIGEAPGQLEAAQRRPFVGRSGQLLRSTLAAVGHEPASVYISNIVKVRPPDNRDPTPAEIAAYKPYLDQEITILNPDLIITLGRFSMAKFLPEVKISQVHGRLHKVMWESELRYVLPMYHPAAALRGTTMKQAFVDDFNKISSVMKWIAQQRQHQQLVTTVEEVLL